ncbi:TPA: hypothetical protein N0F65_012870 [Lagenidium giganteum]|uniref:Uncharacterized protein n=1 Tax=Lagenidium giganteum TaxID=4803 RepID=A0AAV2YG23_9STRA|nr:TPA: hypothetical protein N0F65_012870 [Lagenidium giganteum]
MKLKEDALARGDAQSKLHASGFEDLLLKSQSGLVMLRDMQLKRNAKKQSLRRLLHAPVLGATAAFGADDTTTEGAFPAATHGGDSEPRAADDEARDLAIRMRDYYARKVQLCRLLLRRDRTEHVSLLRPLTSATMLKTLDKAIMALTRLTTPLVHPLDNASKDDLESFLRFACEQQSQRACAERFLIRLKWLLVSHRYHIRQRMLDLFHQQREKNAVVPNSWKVLERLRARDGGSSGSNSNNNATTTASAASLPCVHCPLFILSTNQLEAELHRLLQLPHLRAWTNHTGVAQDDARALKLQVEAQFAAFIRDTHVQNPKRPAGDENSNNDEHESVVESGDERAGDSLAALFPMQTHWGIVQHFSLEHSLSEDASRELELRAVAEDSLLRNELELVRLDDVDYLRQRLETLGSRHFQHAVVELHADFHTATRSMLAGDSTTIALTLTANAHVDNAKAAFERHHALVDKLMGTKSQSWNSDKLHLHYLLRYMNCRWKRQRLVRLLNLFHYVLWERRHRATPRRAYGDHQAQAAAQSRPDGDKLPPLFLRQLSSGEFIVVKASAISASKTDPSEGPKTFVDELDTTEVFFPLALQDLVTIEDQLVRLASKFVQRQDRASVPSASAPSLDDPDTDPDTGIPSHVMLAIDRTQVLSDLYESELNFQQAKCQWLTALLANGLEYADDAHTTALLRSVVQRRPLIDLAHGYFYESYALEVVHLDLQTHVQELMRQHLAAPATSASRTTVSVVKTSIVNDDVWLAHQIVHQDIVHAFLNTQAQLYADAQQQWFCALSVGELHALQQALAERVLLTWKTLTTVEFPSTQRTAVVSLERTAQTLFCGNGWKLVWPPELVFDVCVNSTAGASADTYRALETNLTNVLRVLDWRAQLRRVVYETHVLERIYVFQQEFVELMPTADQHQHFFFGTVGSGVDEKLQTLQAELLAMSHGTSRTSVPANANSASSEPASGGRTNHLYRTVPEWLDTQLAPDAADERSMVLTLQSGYCSFLRACVNYQDTSGGDVFEFAACAPFIFLSSQAKANANASNGSNNHTEGRGAGHGTRQSGEQLNMKAVRWKYTEEIADKMKDELQRHCFLFWISLTALKTLVHTRFFQSPALVRRVEQLVEEADEQACERERRAAWTEAVAGVGAFFERHGATPALVVQLVRQLRAIQNERKLLLAFAPTQAHRCAITAKRTGPTVGDGVGGGSLEQWLENKLQQLKADLQVKTPAPLRPPGTPPSSPKAADKNSAMVAEAASNGDTSLLDLPPTRGLVRQFGVLVGQEDASKARLPADKQEQLTQLVAIYSVIADSVRCSRVHGAFALALSGKSKQRAAHKATSAAAVAMLHHHLLPAALQTAATNEPNDLLAAWLLQVHDDVRRFHHKTMDTLGLTGAHIDVFALDGTTRVGHGGARNGANTPNTSGIVSLGKVHHALHRHAVTLRARLRCLVAFVLHQTLGDGDHDRDTDQDRDPRLLLQRRQLQCVLRELHDVAREDRYENRDSGGDSADLVVCNGVFGMLLPILDHAWLDCVHERETIEFWRALQQTNDDAYLELLDEWLTLQAAYVRDFVDRKKKLQTHGGRSAWSNDTVRLETDALAELEQLYQRYEVLAPQAATSDSNKGVINVVDEGVSGNTLRMKMRLLNNRTTHRSSLLRRTLTSGSHALNAASGTGASFGSGGDSDSTTEAATAGVATTHHTHMLLQLPPPTVLRRQLDAIRCYLEVHWIEDDLEQIQQHYEHFLTQKRRYQEEATDGKAKKVQNDVAGNVTGVNANSRGLSGEFCQALRSLQQYYRSYASHWVDEGDEDAVKAAMQNPEHGEFIVPAMELTVLLQRLEQERVRQVDSLSAMYTAAVDEQQAQRQATDARCAVLQARQLTERTEATIKRESFAIDRSYQLHFQMEKLHKQMHAMQQRIELEKAELSNRLTVAHDAHVREMQAKLLTKQQQFEEYRAVVQQDLRTQLVHAQQQMVQQLVAQSGTVSLEAKTGFLAALHEQGAMEQIQRENVALKQTVLKLQTLFQLQHQSKTAVNEHGKHEHESHTTRLQLVMNENVELAHQLKQLESELSKVSQERSFFQMKWSHLQEQLDSAAHKQRVAKVRGLSAPYHREMATMGVPLVTTDIAGSVDVHSKLPSLVHTTPRAKTTLPDYEDQQQAFEDKHEMAMRALSSEGANNDNNNNNNQHGDGNDGHDVETKGGDGSKRSDTLQRTLGHYQNEIRRLQLQLTKETKMKSTLMDQLALTKAGGPIALGAGLASPGGVIGTPVSDADSDAMDWKALYLQAQEEIKQLREIPQLSTPSPQLTTPRRTTPESPSTHRRLLMHQPSSRARPASATHSATPTRPRRESEGTPRRPSTSHSPRSMLPLAPALVLDAGAVPSMQIVPAPSPRRSSSPVPGSRTIADGDTSGRRRSSSANAAARKFQVQKREEPELGGVAGVPNALSVREPLPYR